MTSLSVSDLLRARDFAGAVTRMQELSRLSDPTEPVDVDAIRARYEERRAQLRSVVEPEPFRIVVVRR
jgi:hypothetical protein